MAMIPTAVFGLHVQCGAGPIPAIPEVEYTNIFRITMAALDPTAPAQRENADIKPRATLKILRDYVDPEEEDSDFDDEDDEDDDDVDAIERRIADALSDEDVSENSEDEDRHGGPSDPARSKKAKKEAALTALLNGMADDESEEEVDGVNGTKKNKGKAKANGDVDDISMSDDMEDELALFEEMDKFVLCTLDPDQHYQQTLDITVGENERVWFEVTGTHDIYVTGNYLVPHVHEDEDDEDEDYDDEMDYDLPPYDEDDESEEDELDDLPDPRIEEVESEDEAPKLIKAAEKSAKQSKKEEKAKASKKRAAEDDEDGAETLEAMIEKATKQEPAEEQKLSKKQLKKLKNNQGQAAAAPADVPKDAKALKDEKAAKDTPNGSAKKVQFAKNLEQGPTPSPAGKATESKKTGLGVKVIKGVTIDDKKLGSGRAAKPGDKIGMRYIGKLQDGKVFDSNKKGKPFQFTLGKGEVIKGWDIGIEGMTVGAERRITIPAPLAYGNKGTAGIPGNSTLVFDVKCMSVN